MIIILDTENTFGKIQHLFMIETLYKLGMKRNFFNLIKGVYGKPAAHVTCNDWANALVYPSYQNRTDALWYFINKTIQENRELFEVSNLQ